jgi:ribosomal protein L29
MAVIKDNELKLMTPKAAEAKIAELEKAILELQGEGKREKIKPLRRTIAKLKTILSRPPEAEKPKV